MTGFIISKFKSAIGLFTLKALRIFLIGLFIFHLSGHATAQELSKSIPDSLQTNDSLTFTSSKADSLAKGVNDSLVKSDSIQIRKNNSGLEAEVKYQAEDSIVFDLRNKGARLYGQAQVDYQTINLKASTIEQNWATNEVIALPTADSIGNLIGKPKFKDGEQEFESKRMVYNFKSKKARISSMVTKEGESYLIGQEVKLNPDQSIYIKNTRYTTCSHTDHPHFYLNLYKAKIIPNKSVVSGPANMVVEGIPVPLGLPFAIIPTQRGQRSGILPPEYGRSPELGFFLRNGGYYFAINDFVDLALRADVYSWGSYRLNPATQYVKKYKYSGRLSFSFSNQQRGDRLADDFVRNRDFFVTWQHQQDPKANPYGRFTASVEAGTSSFLSNNTFASNQFLRNQLTSSVSYSRNFAGKPFRFSIAARHAQNTQTREIKFALPEGSFNVNRIEPFRRKSAVGAERWYEKIGFTYQTNFRNNIAAFDSTLLQGNLIDKMDGGLQHLIPISTSAFVVGKYFQVTPSLNYTERWNFKSLNRAFDPDSNRVIADTLTGFFRNNDYSFSLSVNTRLYGLKQFSRGKLAAIRHVMNPRLGYNLRPDFSAPNFGFYQEVQTDSLGSTRLFSRFDGLGYGGPSAGRSGAFSLNIDNNLEAKIRQRTDTGVVMKKIKIFDSFNFGTIYNLAADSLKLAPITFSGRTSFSNNFSLLFGGTLDPYARAANGQRINNWLIDTDGKLANLTNANLAFSGSIRPQTNAKRAPGNQLGNVNMPAPADDGEAREQEYLRRQQWNQFIDWTVPFNLTFNYTLNYVRSAIDSVPATITQGLQLNGDVSLTPKWKIGYSSGYDFTNKRVTPTVINLYRDLHCWEMSFNLVPFGAFRSYTFTINAKARMLQELKLTRRRDWYDLQRF